LKPIFLGEISGRDRILRPVFFNGKTPHWKELLIMILKSGLLFAGYLKRR